jgi:hypothetical protein
MDTNERNDDTDPGSKPGDKAKTARWNRPVPPTEADPLSRRVSRMSARIWWLAIFNALVLLATFLGSVSAYLQWRGLAQSNELTRHAISQTERNLQLTQEAVRQTTRTNDIAESSARDAAQLGTAQLRVARDANGQARAAMRLERRAWVTVKTAELVKPPAMGEVFMVLLNIINTGQTPASEGMINGTVISRGELSAEDLSGPEVGSVPSRMLIGPGVVVSTLLTASEPVMRQSQIDAILNGAWRLYAVGNIYYRDVFGGRHQTRYCFSIGASDLRLNVRAMAACAEHNEVIDK